MHETLAKHIRERGNRWFLWIPGGLKMSGVVIGNPTFRRGRWFYEDGSTWSTR